jgi:hypothetical protein
MKKSSSGRQAKRCGGTTEHADYPERDDEIMIDRRRVADRRDEEAEAAEAVPAPKLERRKKVNRRRQIDPTTCERDYTDAEVEFMNALDEYKRKSGRMFPTCSEVLEVIRSLGYVKLSPGQFAGGEMSQSLLVSAKPMAGDLQPPASGSLLDSRAEPLA